MNKSIRSLAVVVVMPLLVCCVVTYKHAQIPFSDSRLVEDPACFNACDDGDVECVARCPGAETGDGPCRTDSKVVGGSAQQAVLLHCVDGSERRLTSGGKCLIATAIVGAVAAVAAVFLYALSQPGGWAGS